MNVAGYTSAGGTGFSELSNPTAIYVDVNGTMYILDTNNYRVVKWVRGEPLGFSVVGNRGPGSTLDKFSTSYGMYVDKEMNIYVSDYANHRVTKWFNGNTTAGVVVSITSISMNLSNIEHNHTLCDQVAGSSSMPGNSSNLLRNPYDIYVDANYTIYIVDYGNHRVQKWVRG